MDMIRKEDGRNKLMAIPLSILGGWYPNSQEALFEIFKDVMK